VKSLILLIVVAIVAACSMPQTTVRSGMSQPTLVVAGAPSGSVLVVDGLDMGSAAQYDGNPKVLAVLEGTHQVEVRLGPNVIYREKAFVSSGQSHTVAVAGAASP
jgi:uncharacterized lipoprotein YajG